MCVIMRGNMAQQQPLNRRALPAGTARCRRPPPASPACTPCTARRSGTCRCVEKGMGRWPKGAQEGRQEGRQDADGAQRQWREVTACHPHAVERCVPASPTTLASGATGQHIGAGGAGAGAVDATRSARLDAKLAVAAAVPRGAGDAVRAARLAAAGAPRVARLLHKGGAGEGRGRALVHGGWCRKKRRQVLACAPAHRKQRANAAARAPD